MSALIKTIKSENRTVLVFKYVNLSKSGYYYDVLFTCKGIFGHEVLAENLKNQWLTFAKDSSGNFPTSLKKTLEAINQVINK